MQLNKLVSLTLLSSLTAYNTGCISGSNSKIPLSASTNTETEMYLKINQPEEVEIKATELNSGDPIPGRYIVKFKNNTISESLLNKFKAKRIGYIYKSMSLQLVEEVSGSNLYDNLKKEWI